MPQRGARQRASQIDGRQASRKRGSTESGLQAYSGKVLPMISVMDSKVWRSAALSCALLVLVLLVIDITRPAHAFGLGAQMILSNAATQSYDVIQLTHGSEADRAGIHVGDRMELVDATAFTKAQLLNMHDGQAFRFKDRSNPRLAIVTLHPTRIESSYERFGGLYRAFAFALLVSGSLIAYRRPDRRDARALASFFIGFACIFSILNGNVPDLVWWIEYALQPAVLYFSLAQMTRFACTFPFISQHGVRAWIRRVTPWLSILLALGQLTGNFIYFFTSLSANAWIFQLASVGLAYYVVAVTVAFTIANRQSTGPDRLRSLWASITLAVGFSGIIATTVAQLGFHEFGDWQGIVQLTMLAIPVGMGYVMLRHRMLDLGFAINRALVFTAISLFIVGVLTLVEFVLGKYVVEISHTTSTLIEAAFALALGLSMRPIHDRVDRAVDDLFFRKRHMAERELRLFADEATFVTDRGHLLEATIAVVTAQLHADGAAVLLEIDGKLNVAASSLPSLTPDDNDRAILRMKAHRRPVDLREVGSNFEADVALPMFVRGKFAGTLLCGHKPDAESYAPDELAVLGHVAHAVGVALDSLETEALKSQLRTALAQPAGYFGRL